MMTTMKVVTTIRAAIAATTIPTNSSPTDPVTNLLQPMLVYIHVAIADLQFQ